MSLFDRFSGPSSARAAEQALNGKQAAQEQAALVRNVAALEAVTSSVMIADENHVIVSINPSTLQMMRAAESDIRVQLPGFSAERLVGSSIDIFHQHPAHQRAMLDGLTATYQARIVTGARTFNLTATPIFGEGSKRLGTVVEWQDISAELLREQEDGVRLANERLVAKNNARLKAALDRVTSNVMLADEKNDIVYANDAVLAMLSSAETEIRTQLPNFNTTKSSVATSTCFIAILLISGICCRT